MQINNLSVVIPVLNEGDNLIKLFESILNQSLHDDIKIANIIMVDNGSTDDSVIISKRYCTNVFIKPSYTIANLRNFGANQCHGDILIFIDADCVLADNIFNEIVLLLSDKKIGAVGPDGLIPLGDVTWIQNIWHLQNTAINNNNSTVEVTNLSSGFFAIKKDIFYEVGGFDSNLTVGEDSNISMKLRKINYKLIKSNKLLVFNSGYPRNLWQFIKREYWHGDSIKHLIMHKNIDMMTFYLFINCFMWGSLIFLVTSLKPLFIISLNILALSIIPFYKAVKKTMHCNLVLLQLSYVYIVYALIRSLALFKYK